VVLRESDAEVYPRSCQLTFSLRCERQSFMSSLTNCIMSLIYSALTFVARQCHELPCDVTIRNPVSAIA
jgi:hypothetical protein